MEPIHSGPIAGKTVLITGGTGGIGRATALGLAAMGAHLAITGRDRGRTEGAARLTQRQPDMGLTLYRRFAEAGLVDRQVRLVPSFSTDMAQVRVYGVNPGPTAETLVAEGLLTHERAEALLAYLDEASQDGRFFSYATFPIVAGRVPPPDVR